MNAPPNKMLREMVWQPAERLLFIEAMNLPKWTYDDCSRAASVVVRRCVVCGCTCWRERVMRYAVGIERIGA